MRTRRVTVRPTPVLMAGDVSHPEARRQRACAVLPRSLHRVSPPPAPGCCYEHLPGRRPGQTMNFVEARNLPRHVGIIMDGNGRWAECRGEPREAGHKAGSAAVRRIVRVCRRLGIEALTLYAFSE